MTGERKKELETVYLGNLNGFSNFETGIPLLLSFFPNLKLSLKFDFNWRGQGGEGEDNDEDEGEKKVMRLNRTTPGSRGDEIRPE